MSDEEQERFAEELDQYIEQLRLRRPTFPPANLTPEQVPIYDMATRLYAASPPIGDPSPEFSGQLYQRLLAQMRAEEQEPIPFTPHVETAGVQENRQSTNSSDADYRDKGTERGEVPSPQAPSQDKTPLRSIYRNDQISQPTAISSTHPEGTNAQKHKRRGLSRRTLFTGGAIAASLAGGAAIGAGIEHALQSSASTESSTPNLNPHLLGEQWHQVTSVQQLGSDPIRFNTETITGYVIRQSGNSTEPILAFSAACTHLGCIVQWQESKRQFPCPCHGRTFDATGAPVYPENSEAHYVSLPRLETKIENDNIYVRLPVL